MPQYLSTDPNAGEEIEAPPDEYLSDDPSAGEDLPPGLAARPAVMRAGEPQPWYEGAWDAARQAIFGHPDREEAREAGVGLNPTMAEMVETIGAGASMVGAPTMAGPALGALAARVPGVAGPLARAGAWAGAHPRTVAAAAGAVPGALHGNSEAAMTGAVIGAVTGGRGSGPAAPIARRQGRAAAASATKASPRAGRVPLGQATPATPATAPRGLPPPPMQHGPPAPSASAPPRATPPAAAPARASTPDPGRAAAEAHRKLTSFAKDVAAKNPKVGEKIWMQLDDAGNPVKYLTPDQAGAAARAGLNTTWVKNLWSAGAR